jgi:hypothetical protein
MQSKQQESTSSENEKTMVEKKGHDMVNYSPLKQGACYRPGSRDYPNSASNVVCLEARILLSHGVIDQVMQAIGGEDSCFPCNIADVVKDGDKYGCKLIEGSVIFETKFDRHRSLHSSYRITDMRTKVKEVKRHSSPA